MWTGAAMSGGLGVTRSALAGVAMRRLQRAARRLAGAKSSRRQSRHFEPIDCLIRFGKRWRGDASEALVAFGLEPPSLNGDQL
jgi:hypothetical protein